MPTSADAIDLVRRFHPESVDMVEFFGDPGAVEVVSALDVFADDVEVQFIATHSSDVPTYSGVQGLIEGWREWLTPWASYHLETRELTDAGGGQILGLIHARARTERDGVVVEADPAFVHPVR